MWKVCCYKVQYLHSDTFIQPPQFFFPRRVVNVIFHMNWHQLVSVFVFSKTESESQIDLA